MYADKKKIEWLLFESGVSRKLIHEKSGVKLTTITDLRKKRSSINLMRFDNAANLTAYVDELKKGEHD